MMTAKKDNTAYRLIDRKEVYDLMKNGYKFHCFSGGLYIELTHSKIKDAIAQADGFGGFSAQVLDSGKMVTIEPDKL